MFHAKDWMFHAKGRLSSDTLRFLTRTSNLCVFLEGAAWFSRNAFTSEAQQILHCLCDVEERLAFLALQRCRQV